MLVKETDPNFAASEPKTELLVSFETTLKTKDKYVRPTTWGQFVMLFMRRRLYLQWFFK
jgi:hypothetical protein